MALTATAALPADLALAAAACSGASTASSLGYPNSEQVCGERAITTTQKLSEQANRARIISICPLHNIVGV